MVQKRHRLSQECQGENTANGGHPPEEDQDRCQQEGRPALEYSGHRMPRQLAPDVSSFSVCILDPESALRLPYAEESHHYEQRAECGNDVDQAGFLEVRPVK